MRFSTAWCSLLILFGFAAQLHGVRASRLQRGGHEASDELQQEYEPYYEEERLWTEPHGDTVFWDDEDYYYG